MSDARVEKVFEDRVSAREFLLQAEGFLVDADAASLSAPSRAVLIHQATVSACDAILQSAGFRVTAGDGSHMLRIQAALEQVDGNTEELLERLDASRARRNEASCEARFVAEASVADARDATRELMELAREIVR